MSLMGSRRAFVLGVGTGLAVASVGVAGFMVGSGGDATRPVASAPVTTPQPSITTAPVTPTSSASSTATVGLVTSTSRALLAVEYTDSALLIRVADEFAQRLMGRNLSQTELDPFVDYFHEQEMVATANLNAGYDYVRPDPEGQAESWIRTKFADEVAAYATLEAYDDLVDIIIGGTTSTTSCDPINEFCL